MTNCSKNWFISYYQEVHHWLVMYFCYCYKGNLGFIHSTSEIKCVHFKSTTCRMPTVISPSCFLGRFIRALTSSHLKYPLKHVLLGPGDLWPMIFTYEFDLHIPPFDIHADFQVCMFVRSATRVVTHTHTHNIKTITLTAGVINESYEHIVKKKKHNKHWYYNMLMIFFSGR